jgi:CBS domain-containing protein
MQDDFLSEEQQIADERDQAHCHRSDEGLFERQVLHKPIRDLPQLQPLVRIPPTASVREAINMMIERRVGCLTVVEGETLVGVFSERDVLTKVAVAGLDLDAKMVGELMTRNPQTLAANSRLVYALHQMTIGGYRHIPLLDADKKPVAIISMRDIVACIVDLYPDEVLKLPESPEQKVSSSREGA